VSRSHPTPTRTNLEAMPALTRVTQRMAWILARAAWGLSAVAIVGLAYFGIVPRDPEYQRGRAEAKLDLRSGMVMLYVPRWGEPCERAESVLQAHQVAIVNYQASCLDPSYAYVDGYNDVAFPELRRRLGPDPYRAAYALCE